MTNRATLVFVMLLALTAQITYCRDPETVQEFSLEQCKELGVYRVPHGDPWWCCKCSGGFYKAADCGFALPKTTNCAVCPFDPLDSKNQTYTTGPNNLTECLRSMDESQCAYVRNAYWMIGSQTQPSSCACLDGYYATPEALMVYGCNRHSPCEPGFEPAVLGNETANTLCKRCSPGTFSNVSSPTDICRPHSGCQSNEKLEEVGTKTTDTVCSKVEKLRDRARFSYIVRRGYSLIFWRVWLLNRAEMKVEPGRIGCNCPDVVGNQANWTIIVPISAAILLIGICSAIFCYRRRKRRPCCEPDSRSVNYEEGRPSSKDKTLPFEARKSSGRVPVPSSDPLLPRKPEAPPGADSTETQCLVENEQNPPLGSGTATNVDGPASKKENSVKKKKHAARNNAKESHRTEEICKINPENTVKYITEDFPNPVHKVSKTENSVLNKPSAATKESRQTEGAGEMNPWNIVEYIRDYCDNSVADDKDRRLLTFDGWKEVIKKLQYDSQIGHKIILSLNKFRRNALRPIIRLYLDEVDVSDIEDNYLNKGVQEVRHQWIRHICSTYGTLLTPDKLLLGVFDKKCFGDALTSAFIGIAVEQLQL